MRIGRYVVVPLVLVATLAWCAATGAVIVVGRARVRVGSTLAYVEAHVPRVHCSRSGSPPRVGCYVGTGRYTGLNTTFGVGADGRVKVIAIRNLIG